ncbi:hypothetical protein STN0717CIT72_07800 [Citrobacter portucalensis]|nr:hypothetical protein STN0717CIT72_07800 [Citrobacter portucalensis]
MTSLQQRAELHRQIWAIANDVRGSVDGWDFKQYVLGALFYRFISENFSSYMEAGDESIHYAALDDSIITDDIKDDAIRTKGYFIYPSQLFCNVAAKANTNDLSLDQILIPCAIRSLAARKPSSLLCRASQPSQRAPQLAIPVRLLSIKPPSLAIAM